MKGISQLAVIPMRKEASDRSEMVNQVLYGETFEVLERQEKWSRIKLQHDLYEGWIDNKQYEICKPSKEKKQLSVVDTLFIRKAPQFLPMGALFPKPASQSKHTILSTARKFLEVPYLWGGRTFMGIDCSGFTQIVFRVNGIKLKRDAAQQETQGKKIKLENCATNDLAFFSNDAGRVVHVGIIFKEKGKTKIIHASGKVRIDDMDEKGIFNRDTQNYSHRLHSIKRIG